jgi:hypothetical protein
MKKTQVFFWVTEVRRGRKDFSDQERAGKPPIVGLDDILAYRLERDPDTAARRLTASLGISPNRVLTRLHEGLGMKFYHLRSVPHTLTETGGV